VAWVYRRHPAHAVRQGGDHQVSELERMTDAIFDFAAINRRMNRKPVLEPVKVEEPKSAAQILKAVMDSFTLRYEEVDIGAPGYSVPAIRTWFDETPA
jgi:hypothetical protein